MTSPTPGSAPLSGLNFVVQICTDFKESKDTNKYENALNRLFLLEGTNVAITETSLAVHLLLQDLIPYLSIETIYQYESKIKSLVDKFIDLQEEFKLYMSLGKRHSSAKLAIESSIALRYFAKGYRLGKAHNIPNFRNALRKTHKLFLRVVCNEIENSLVNAYPNNKQLFGQWLDTAFYFHNRCYDGKDREAIEAIYNLAMGLIEPKGRGTNADFASFISPLKTKATALHNQQLLSENSIVSIESHRSNLDTYRSRFDQPHADVRAFQQSSFNEFKDKFFVPLLEEVFSIIGPAPCDYDFVALGSTARGELRPYSDLEWIILIQDEREKGYFKRLYRILDFLIVALGEKKTKPGIVLPSLYPDEGFHVECPGGDSQLDEQIGLPESIARNLDHPLDGPFGELENMILTATSLASSSKTTSRGQSQLFHNFQEAVNAILDASIRDDTTGGKIPHRRIRAFKRLHERNTLEFARSWGTNPLRREKFRLKEDFVQTLNYALRDLAIYFSIEELSTLAIIEKLHAKSVFSKKSRKLLEWGVKTLYTLQIKSDLKRAEYLDDNSLKLIYLVVIWPIYNLIGQAKIPQDIEALFKNVDLMEKAYKLSLALDLQDLKIAIPLLVATQCVLGISADEHFVYCQRLANIPKHGEELRMLFLETLGNSFRSVLDRGKSVVLFDKIPSSGVIEDHVEDECDAARQSIILMAARRHLELETDKPTVLTLRSSSVLNTESLRPLLHSKLEYLDIRDCPHVCDQDVVLINQCCPNLRELYFSGCQKITGINLPGWVTASPLAFAQLRVLGVQNCQSLKSIFLNAPLLTKLSLSRNPLLETVRLLQFALRPEVTDCPKLKNNGFEVIVERFDLWLKNSPISFRDEKDIVIRTVMIEAEQGCKPGNMAFQHVDDRLREDKEFVQQVVGIRGVALKYVSANLQNDWAIVLSSIRQDVSSFQYASPYLKGKREFVLIVTKFRSGAFQYASGALKSDPNFILEVVRQSPDVLEFVNPDLKEYPEIVLEAVKTDGLALTYASKKMQDTEKIVLAAVQQEATALRFASGRLQGTKAVVLEALKGQRREALWFASKELQGDPEVIEAAGPPGLFELVGKGLGHLACFAIALAYPNPSGHKGTGKK